MIWLICRRGDSQVRKNSKILNEIHFSVEQTRELGETLSAELWYYWSEHSAVRIIIPPVRLHELNPRSNVYFHFAMER